VIVIVIMRVLGKMGNIARMMHWLEALPTSKTLPKSGILLSVGKAAASVQFCFLHKML
jgi:hypothetical protein